MKDFNYYAGKDLTFPKAMQFTRYHVYQPGNPHALHINITAEELEARGFFRAPEKQKIKGVDYLVSKTVEGFDEARKTYHSTLDMRREEFYEDLCDEHGYHVCKSSRILFDYAWQEGHSAGFYEVANKFGEIDDMLLRYTKEKEKEKKRTSA